MHRTLQITNFSNTKTKHFLSLEACCRLHLKLELEMELKHIQNLQNRGSRAEPHRSTETDSSSHCQTTERSTLLGLSVGWFVLSLISVGRCDSGSVRFICISVPGECDNKPYIRNVNELPCKNVDILLDLDQTFSLLTSIPIPITIIAPRYHHDIKSK